MHDPVGFLADQAGQRDFLAGHGLLQQLGRTTNARERVLDLMRQHRGEPRHRPCSATRHHLPVDLVGHGPFLDEQRHSPVIVGQRAGEYVGDAFIAKPRRPYQHPILGHRGPPQRHGFNQADNGRTKGDQIVEPMADQHTLGGAKKRLSRIVDENDLPIVAAHDDRLRQGLNDRCGRYRNGSVFGLNCAHHAAFRSSEKMSPIMVSTAAGVSLLRSAARVGLSRSIPAAARYQPRCLRAARRPTATPYSTSMSSYCSQISATSAAPPGCSRGTLPPSAAPIWPTRQGCPCAPRPSITAAAPDKCKASRAASRSTMSPLTTTGTSTASTTARTSSQRALPL